MNSLEANTRNTKSKGDVNTLRLNGNVPAIKNCEKSIL